MVVRLTQAELRRLTKTNAAGGEPSTPPAVRRAARKAPTVTPPPVAYGGGNLEVPGALGAFWFGIPFAVRSKSNFRRSDSSQAWGAEVDFESDVRSLALRHRPSGWVLGPTGRGTLTDRPVIVSVIYARGVIDAGNLSKSVLDACESVVFHNDASARLETSMTDRAATGKFGLVAFAALAQPADHRQMLGVANTLGALLLDRLDGPELQSSDGRSDG